MATVYVQECGVVGEEESAYNVTFVHGSARIGVYAKFNELFSDAGSTIGEFIKIVYNGCDSVDEAISRFVLTNEKEKRDYEQLSKKLTKFEEEFDSEEQFGFFLRDLCRREIDLKKKNKANRKEN